METISLVTNFENQYVNKNNEFFKKIKKDEFKKNDVFLIGDNNDILLHHWKVKNLEESIFSHGLSKPSYFKMQKGHVINLMNFLIQNNFHFHIEYNLKVNDDIKDFLLDYKDIFKKNNGELLNNKDIDELFDDYSYIFDNRSQYAFKIYKKIKEEHVSFTLNNLFLFYTDSRTSDHDFILNEAMNFYKIALDKDISLTPINIELKEIKNHPYSHIHQLVGEFEKLIEKEDANGLLSFMKDNKENITMIKKAFKSYENKTIEK